MSLNEAQQKAVRHTNGPLMVLAGAGAGKTRVITHRIAHLIENGASPQSILAVTFTNKAAKEMRERVHKILEHTTSLNRPVSYVASGNAYPFVATFHSLCVHILREESKTLGIPRQFTIYDRNDSMRAIRNAIKDVGLDPKQFEPRAVLGHISKLKGKGISASEYKGERSPWHAGVRLLYLAYEKILQGDKALDFDDLLLRVYQLLEQNKEVRTKLQARWTHLLVDEYQDTNRVQFSIIQLLAGEAQNVCVVGDIDQNVYSWRGATLDNLLSFEHTFKDPALIVLEQNYRSTQNILQAANDIIIKNERRKEKNLFTENESGDPIFVYTAGTENDEARFVVQRAQQEIKEGTPPEEIAVLYRANFQSRVLEEAFLMYGVPYQVLGTKFFEREEVKHALAYIRASLNPESFGDITRIIGVPTRGIGKTTLAKMAMGHTNTLPQQTQQKISEFYTTLTRIKSACESQTASKAMLYAIKESGLEKHYSAKTEEDAERLQNLHELVSLAGKYDGMNQLEGIEKLLEEAALATDQDDLAEIKPGVKLMTIHASKGLEFNTVFITGLEEGLFPSGHEGDEDRDSEEERRLFYVAITRAKKRVILTHATMRTIFGMPSINAPSQFIADLNNAYVEVLNEHGTARADLGHDRGIDLIDW